MIRHFFALSLLVLPHPILRAETGPRVVVIRQEGQPDRTCAVEASWRQADGTLAHRLRDPATGERFTVIDDRPGVAEPPAKPSPQPPRWKHWFGLASSPVVPPTPGQASIVAVQPGRPRPEPTVPSAEIVNTSHQNPAENAAIHEDECDPLTGRRLVGPRTIDAVEAALKRRAGQPEVKSPPPGNWHRRAVAPLASAAKADPSAPRDSLVSLEEPKPVDSGGWTIPEGSP